MPKKKKPAKRRELYKSPPPKSEANSLHATPISPSHFTLREDGSIQSATESPRRGEQTKTGLTGLKKPEEKNPVNSVNPVSTPRLVFSSNHPFLRLYHGNCLELLDAIDVVECADSRDKSASNFKVLADGHHVAPDEA